jgi:hypothetical protein
MLHEAARWDDLVIGLRPMSYGAKGVLARCLVSVGPVITAKASSEGWRLRLRPNKQLMDSYHELGVRTADFEVPDREPGLRCLEWIQE